MNPDESTHNDVARTEAQAALATSEARMRAVLEAAVDGIISITERGTIQTINPAAERLFGCTQDEVIGQNIKVLMPSPYQGEHDVYLARYLATGEKRIIGSGREVLGRRQDGTTFPMDLSVAEARMGDERIFVGIIRDITERKRAEQALRESEERFRGTFENAAVGIAHEDLAGRFLRFNETFCAILGYPPTELVGKTLSEVTHPEDLAADLAKFDALTRGESTSYTLEKRFIRKDRSSLWADVTVSLQFDAARKPTYCIKIIQDISDRKRLEAELRHAKEAAEAANRAKDEFLANVSHEIRTPMNAILGMTELVLDTPLTEDQRGCLKAVKSGADSLLRIINDLLDFSKIEAGKLELDPADFSLRRVLGETLRVLAMRAHKKGLELVSDVQPEVPDALIGDAGRLRQVLLNLVGNAIKFTDDGEVVVRVQAAAESAPEQGVGLLVTVRDTGIGISPDKQETIFRAFEQEDTSTTRKYGGTGLGLTITARLVALMGGAIHVESAPGRGSTFAFTARFGRQLHPPEPVAAAPPPLLHDLRVLIVDDNATNRHILEQWLRGWQMEPVAVGDGLAALNALWHGTASNRPYALVLLDARMPDTDGLKLATMIRERAELAATRIIMLTSGNGPVDSARYRELRIDAQLLKPAQQDELLETIYGVMSQPNANAAPTHRPPPAPETATALVPVASALRILVAEDNELSAQVMEQLLTRRGHRVRLVSNGREALALSEEGGFDLLLLDVHMPELDGFQVVREIRERERTAAVHLPVIALTARSRKEDREHCLAAGMDEFLTKPIRPADLWAAIAHVQGARRPAARPGPPLLDPRVLLATCGNDAGTLAQICQLFRARLPDDLAQVREALRDRDAARLRKAAHKLCGTLGVFSTVAGAVVSDLEDHAALGQLEEALPLLERLETMADELISLAGGMTLETLRHHAQGAGDPDPTAR